MVYVAGHFGEWVQGRLGPRGEVALITLACPVIGVRATWGRHAHDTIPPATDVIGVARFQAFCAALALPTDAAIALRSDLPPGLGTGMSTAALVAAARLAGADDGRLPAACLAAEGASDPLMLPHPDRVLWASRKAKVVQALPAPPAAEVVGGIYGPAQRTDPFDTDFPDISDLIDLWAKAKTLPLAADIATRSAARTTAHRGPQDDPTSELAQRIGALGYARAHTGPARALLFAPGTVPQGAETTLARAGFRHVVRFRTGAP